MQFVVWVVQIWYRWQGRQGRQGHWAVQCPRGGACEHVEYVVHGRISAVGILQILFNVICVFYRGFL